MIRKIASYLIVSVIVLAALAVVGMFLKYNFMLFTTTLVDPIPPWAIVTIVIDSFTFAGLIVGLAVSGLVEKFLMFVAESFETVRDDSSRVLKRYKEKAEAEEESEPNTF